MVIVRIAWEAGELLRDNHDVVESDGELSTVGRATFGGSAVAARTVAPACGVDSERGDTYSVDFHDGKWGKRTGECSFGQRREILFD